MRRPLIAIAALLALLAAGCGGGSHTTASTPATRPHTTEEFPQPELPQWTRCTRRVSLDGPRDLAGPTVVFLAGEGARQLGCARAASLVAAWASAGAQPGGYASGPFNRFRCDDLLGGATEGPLGDRANRYSGVIHCAVLAGRSLTPTLELDGGVLRGIWAYVGKPVIFGSGNHPATGPNAIPGARLLRGLRRQLLLFARVRPDAVDCPAVDRRRGASVRCTFSGAALDYGNAPVHGSAQLTVQDRRGREVLATYSYASPKGQVRGTGYPFAP